MLEDIDKDTVDWAPNFDGSLSEPIVLPTRFPNLLVNGTTGIAVGMSTSILPHNLGEVCDAVKYVAQNWKKREQISVQDLMHFIPGPDLPTGGLLYRYRVNGGEEAMDMIAQAYESGHATMVCQAKADIQDIGGGKSEILVTELPYQVQKTTILERIAAYREKFVGITDVRDESDSRACASFLKWRVAPTRSTRLTGCLRTLKCARAFRRMRWLWLWMSMVKRPPEPDAARYAD